MLQEGMAWFGDELSLPITVVVPEPSALAILATGMVGLPGCNRRTANNVGNLSWHQVRKRTLAIRTCLARIVSSVPFKAELLGVFPKPVNGYVTK